MELVPKTITRPVGRLGAAAQNALEVARFGGLATDEQPSPYEIAAEQRVYKLRHYYPGSGTRAPVLLVPPMMLAAEVYDVSPATSAVTILREHGADPWVVDFGAPEREEGGLERTLADHVVAISDAVDRVQATDRPRRPPRRLLAGRDVRATRPPPTGATRAQLADHVRQPRRHAARDAVRDSRAARIGGRRPARRPRVPGLGAPGLGEPDRLPRCSTRSSRRATGSSSSSSSTTARRCCRREGQRRFLEADGWVAWPGPAMADFLQQFIAHNRMLEGGFVIGDRLLSLADIACPILSVVGTVDEIAPAAGVRAIRLAAPRAEVYELALPRGPFRARRRLDVEYGHLADRAGVGPLARRRRRTARARSPRSRRRPRRRRARAGGPQPRRLRARAGRRRSGRGRPLGALAAARRTAGGVRELTREAASQLPRLARLEQVQPTHPDLARAAGRGAHAQRRPTTPSSCSRTAPTAPARSASGSTTSSAA